MKKNYLLALGAFFTISLQGFSQCTPVGCLPSLPPYGGICDTLLINGSVNAPYNDFESFHVTTACFDGGLINPGAAGIGVQITSVHTITFAGLPAGLTGGSNQPTYTPPANGCFYFSGTPTEAGVFAIDIDFLANATGYPTGGGACTGFPFSQPNNAAFYTVDLTVLPDPSFSLPSSTYCELDGSVAFTISGTPGGTFSGPGVSGSNFDPSVAGVGTHTLWYHVTAQQGAAIAPATDSSSISVTVTAPPYSYYPDVDADSYGDESATAILSCSAIPPGGFVADNTDCDDGNNAINPAALEIPANSIDENCDGVDAAVDIDLDGFNSDVDCNDNNNTVYPGAPEICDGLDNDCNTLTDDGLTFVTYYQDLDNDTYGNSAVSVSACSPPVGYVTNNTDCNDANNAIYPGAPEICDGLDNNCNTTADDGLTFITYYIDQDNDTYGDASVASISACSPQVGYVTDSTDCNDGNNAIHPGATDLLGNSIDENCDGVDGVLGVEATNALLGLSIYPNPASHSVFINGNSDTKLLVRIMNMNGSVVMQQNVQFQNSHMLNVSEITPGFYILELTDVNTQQTGFMRVIISR